MDRDLIRRAAEHVGTLAEEAKTRYDQVAYVRRSSYHRRNTAWNRYTKLMRLSKELIDLAEGK